MEGNTADFLVLVGEISRKMHSGVREVLCMVSTTILMLFPVLLNGSVAFGAPCRARLALVLLIDYVLFLSCPPIRPLPLSFSLFQPLLPLPSRLSHPSNTPPPLRKKNIKKVKKHQKSVFFNYFYSIFKYFHFFLQI